MTAEPSRTNDDHASGAVVILSSALYEGDRPSNSCRPPAAHELARGYLHTEDAIPRRSRQHDSPRYGTMRWRRTAKRVLARDLYVCRIVEGCTQRATVADHIVPATPDMPDWLFFSPGNLRAGCVRHNIARGLTDPIEPNRSEPAVVSGDYS